MSNDIPAISRHLNIPGLLNILLASILFILFLNIDEYHESIYFLVAACTSVIIAVLAFGFSKIIELLDQISK